MKMDNHIREIMIGDYADIIFDKTKNETHDSIYDPTYHYYVIKIEPQIITILPVTGKTKQLELTKNNNIWQINGHIVTFSKNNTQTKYFARDFSKDFSKDFTQANPSSISVIDHYQMTALGGDYTELQNGIILHQLKEQKGILAFSDPNEVGKPFLQVSISDKGEDCRIMNYASDNKDNKDNKDDIYLYFDLQRKIVKFNLNDLTFEDIERNTDYFGLFPLRNKKVLYFLNDGSIHILDLITKQIIDIHGILNPIAYPMIHQLTNGDIIFNVPHNSINYNITDKTEIYRININDGTVNKIATFTGWVDTIAILKDDTIAILKDDAFLLWTVKRIQLWINPNLNDNPNPNPNINSNPNLNPNVNIDNKLIDIYSLNLSNSATSINSIILINGDVLFIINGKFYLFNYAERTIMLVPALNTPGDPIGNIGYYRNFKELKSGNIIMSNGAYLSIVKFPLNQNEIDKLNFDKISVDIRNLNHDMLALIRENL